MPNNSFFNTGVSREEWQRRYNAAPHVQRSQSLQYRVSDFDIDPFISGLNRRQRWSSGLSYRDAHVQPYYHRQILRDVPDAAARHSMRRARARARERTRQFNAANQFRSINDRYGSNIY